MTPRAPFLLPLTTVNARLNCSHNEEEIARRNLQRGRPVSAWPPVPHCDEDGERAFRSHSPVCNAGVINVRAPFSAQTLKTPFSTLPNACSGQGHKKFKILTLGYLERTRTQRIEGSRCCKFRGGRSCSGAGLAERSCWAGGQLELGLACSCLLPCNKLPLKLGGLEHKQLISHSFCG